MSDKVAVFLGMTIGSTIGGYLPTILGADMLSYTTIFTSGVGAILGIIVAYKLTQT